MQLGLVVGDALPVVARVLAQGEAVAELGHFCHLLFAHILEAARAREQVDQHIRFAEVDAVIDHGVHGKVVQRQAVAWGAAAFCKGGGGGAVAGAREVAVFELLEHVPGFIGLQHLGVTSGTAIFPENEAAGLGRDLQRAKR